MRALTMVVRLRGMHGSRPKPVYTMVKRPHQMTRNVGEIWRVRTVNRSILLSIKEGIVTTKRIHCTSHHTDHAIRRYWPINKMDIVNGVEGESNHLRGVGPPPQLIPHLNSARRSTHGYSLLGRNRRHCRWSSWLSYTPSQSHGRSRSMGQRRFQLQNGQEGGSDNPWSHLRRRIFLLCLNARVIVCAALLWS